MRFELRVKNWQSYVPILETLKSYRPDDLSHDLVAGSVVAVVTVPQAMAYAYLAGLPPQAGLYACLLPMLIYTIFGSARHLVVGPVAVAALMVATAIAEHAPRYSDAYAAIAIALSLQVGIMLLLLRLWQMGGLVNLLSYPVITGFINAAAILILLSQVPALVGLPSQTFESPLEQVGWLWENLSEVQLTPVLFGVTALAALLLYPRLAKRFFPRLARGKAGEAVTRIGAMLVAVVSILVVMLFEPDLPTVGQVPSGLPVFTMPVFEWQLWIDLLPSAFMISIVAYVESYSIGTTLAARDMRRVNSHQELIALGTANLGAAFTGAYPVAGSFSRSSVNYDAGARTPISSVVCGIVIVAVLMFLTPWFAYLPTAALGAIVVVSVLTLMDMRSIGRHWRLHREDAITGFITLVTVLVFGVETGLITGVALSLAFFIRNSSRPQVTPIGRVANTEHFRSLRRHDVHTVKQALALRIDENIYFANANQIENKVLKAVHRRPGTTQLLLVCSAVNLLDVTGVEMLFRINRSLQRLGVTLHVAEAKDRVAETLERADLKAALTGNFYFTTDQAMRELEAPEPQDLSDMERRAASV